jgi:hypothetical protein
MKIRKAIKCIAAIGAGISMVGATILGAMAADLSAYPAPFVKNGQFDGSIVVGDTAAAEDVVGAIDIGASLQYAMRQQATSGMQDTITISDGKKIEKTGDKLNYGEDIKDIIEVMDGEDLPVILSDGRFQDQEGETSNDEQYTQSLTFTDNTGSLVYAQDDDGEKKSDSYLYFDDTSKRYAYKYTLEFDSGVDYTTTAADTPAEDMEDNVLKIQGNDYTITDVKYDSSFEINKLTLIAGETVIWLQQGKTLARTMAGVEHEVEVVDVNDAETMCGISVDGDVVWVKKHQTQTINGVSVGVTDAVAVHAQLQDTDICKINLGATELVLYDNNPVKVNAKEVEGSEANFYGEPGELNSIEVTWVPDDDEYLSAGQNLADPVFGNWEFKYAGMTKKTEELSLMSSSDEATFEFVSNDGKDVEMPYYWNGNSIELGNDYSGSSCEGRLLLSGENCDSSAVNETGSIEGTMFLLTTSGNEPHVMEVSHISNNNETTLKDITYGKTYNDKAIATDGSVSSITLGSLGTIQLMFDPANGDFAATETDLSDNNVVDTKYGASIVYNAWNTTTNSTEILFYEKDTDKVWHLGLSYDSVNEDVHVQKPYVTNSTGDIMTTGSIPAVDIPFSKSNKDDRYTVTEWGTIADYNSDDKDSLVISYPDEQAYGNVFVAPIGATVGSGDGYVVTLNPMHVGAARLASEIAGQEKTQNLILVGGPCANEAAKIIMGTTEDCTAGFTAGKAMVRLYENGDNVAMVVAGMNAADTRRATNVVAAYADYSGKMIGSEIEVSGTSMSDITVQTPQ